ncbi:MAG: hypothetical protein Q9167_005433 [Letrouitia subvulpina]
MRHLPWRNRKEKRKGKKVEDTASASTIDGESSNSLELQSSTERSGLFPLADCGSVVENAVDIIAVHGLGGHWNETWTGTTQKNWLRDFLPKQLHDEGVAARILSFGYDSRTAFTKAVIDIGDVADMLLNRVAGKRESEQEKSRPLIFISHSLGGIVVKKAITRAYERSSLYRVLLQRVYGVVFMGVPHRGADLAFWGSFAANVLQLGQLGLGTNPKFMEALTRHSPTFADISEQFVERAVSLSIYTFFETERLGNQVIVDKGSAVLNLANENAVGLPETNHRTICKFERVDNQRYLPVWHAIRKLCQSALRETHTAIQISDDYGNHQERQSNDLRDCLRAFKTSDYESQKNVNPIRANGTCKWTLEHPRYREWHDNPYDDLLWISADPGCGKSVLSKSLIDRDFSRYTVCYFFFKDNENQDSLATALCALIHQLFSGQPGLIRYALPSWEKAGEKVLRDVDELWRILLGACEGVKAGKIICVLDALDECRDNDRKRLIAMLTAFYTSRTPDMSRNRWLKFLVTSRPYEVIQDHFSENLHSLPSIRLRGEEENDQIQHEIDLVIEKKVEKLASDLELASDIKDNLKHQLLSMRNRTYLWLHLAVEEIRETYRGSFRPHREFIQSLPATVEDAYEKILERGAIKNKDKVYIILQIIVGARRPLTVAEMAVALGVATSPPSELKLDIDENYVAAHLPHWCGLFVFINYSRIYLIHQTAKEFLVRDTAIAVASNQGWKHCLSMIDIELSMTTICVRYLAERDLSIWPSKTQSHAQRGSAYFFIKHDAIKNQKDADPFWVYSAECWTGHVRSIQDEVSLFPMDRVIKLYNSSEERLQLWFPILWEATKSDYKTPKMDKVRLAAFNGHNHVLQILLETDEFDLNTTDEQRETALILGSRYGYTKVVQILLDNGADVNAQGRHYGSALLAALWGGYSEIIQILLDNGADVNAPDKDNENALQMASDRGYSEIVQILLDNGADVNAQDKDGDNALELAAYRGYSKIVKALIDHRADINAQGGHFGNALQAASYRGRSEIVQILLDNGADINAQGGHFGNALQAASEGGHSEIVQILLNNGADVNAQGGKYGHALQAASYRGRSEIVQILLDNGADVNAQGGSGTALQVASWKGYREIVQILLDNGADVNAQDGYGTALQVALEKGHSEIVQILLDNGARNAVQAAS